MFFQLATTTFELPTLSMISEENGLHVNMVNGKLIPTVYSLETQTGFELMGEGLRFVSGKMTVYVSYIMYEALELLQRL